MEVLILPFGNTGSLRRAFERLGATVRTTLDPEATRSCPHLVVPGVGHFGAYMRRLRENNLEAAILDRIAQNKPTLAICAGMQALTEGSDEAPDVPGLGVLPVRCERITPQGRAAFGWTRVTGADINDYAYFVHAYAAMLDQEFERGGSQRNTEREQEMKAALQSRAMSSESTTTTLAPEISESKPLRAALRPSAFIQSQHTTCTASHDGATTFLAAWRNGPILATQFHPEKSANFGAALLKAWLTQTTTTRYSELKTRNSRLTSRIIACLDVNAGALVKGEQFVDLVSHGDPAEAAERYQRQGADEIVILDIGATHENRAVMLDTITAVADRLAIPLTAGGGVRTLEDADALFDAGADRITLNSAAVADPGLITRIADRYGSQAVVCAIDAKRHGETHIVYTRGGRRPTGLDAPAWARAAVAHGAGEIMLTSMDRDGSRQGYDEKLIRSVSEAVVAPVIASGGYGRDEHAVRAINAGADAVLLAGCLHRAETTIADVKAALASAGIEVRPC
ncbi:MAG: imidazole glycerol phosphate synthase subunit HisF [Phycisphaeraceae bacterium]|nr:MAG: imidazole glycerol phosphate synthase subunit HisF [Phycisphaeraceae bacterium]